MLSDRDVLMPLKAGGIASLYFSSYLYIAASCHRNQRVNWRRRGGLQQYDNVLLLKASLDQQNDSIDETSFHGCW